MKNLKRVVITASLIFVACFCLIGFAHTPYGRPLFPIVQMLFGQPKSCPLGYDKTPSVADQKQNSVKYMSAHSQAKITHVKPIPDFNFGQSQKAEIEKFAKEHHGSCTTLRSGELECLNVQTVHGTKSLWAMFGPDSRLTHFRAIESIADVQQASADYSKLNEMIKSAVGEPTGTNGSTRPQDLKSGLLYQAVREYYYRNYFAVLRITNHGATFTISSEYNDPEAYGSASGGQIAKANPSN